MLMGTITILVRDEQTEIKSVENRNGKYFTDLVRSRLSQDTHQPLRNPYETFQSASQNIWGPLARTGAEDHLGMLKQLGELHQAGMLTDAEFAEKKAEILRRI